MALNGANAVPVENARVRLLLPPVEATPAYETRTDGFGLFGIKDMAPGAYRLVVEHPGYQRYETNLVAVAGGSTNKMIRLTPIDGKIVFDVFFQAFCLQTHAALAGGKIVAEYWKPDGSITGPPDATFNGVLDQFGAVSFPAMEDGFYTFRGEHAGWETLKYTPPANAGLILVGDKVRLSKSYYGSVFLRPIKQSLKVTAKGFDPVKNQPGPLAGMTIHITGIDLVNDNIKLIPAISATSGEDGSFKFGNLAPVRWRVEVARLGYKVAKVIVKPNADGSLPDQVLDLELEPTKVRVRAASLYQKDEAVKGTVIQLKGVQGGNTEGIARQAIAAPDGTNFTASALFENLLPGRYWIHLKQETTITGLPANSGVLRGPTSFRLSFFPKESYTQAVIAETSELKIDLEAVPAVIRGRLMATDQLGNLLTERSDPEPHRIWRKMSHDGITFLEHKLIKLLAETNNSVVVDTDEAGNFTALVPPGIFGVRIPTMTTHTGHNIEIGDLTDNLAAPRTSPWPYADIWPYPTFEGGHHGAGLAFDSRHEYQLNLFVHRNYINICGTIASPSAPFFDLVLRMDRDGGNALTYPYNHLYDVGAQVIADGPQRYAGKVLPDNSYLIENLKPGTYKLSVDNPLYTLPDKSFTIAPWDPPGIIPSTRPGAPGYYFPGITHIAGEFTLNPDWIAKGNIFIKRFNWVTGDFPGYQDQGSGPPSFFRMEGLPNRLFRYAFKNIPAPSYTIWRLYGSDWFTASGSGPMDFEAYTGGPRPNASPDKAPTEGGGYTLDLHAYSWKDRNFAISNIVVEFVGGGTRVANGFVPWDGRPQALNATDPNQQWNYIGSEAKLVNPDTKVVQMNVFMIRNSLVKVNVTDTNGRPVPNAAVVLRNRFGNPVSQRVTGVEGTASFAGITPQVLYIDVSRRGYIPQRVMKTPSAEDPDITSDIKLEEVPPPTIDRFTMNRFGIFLPGVSRSHDAEGLDPQNAAKRLTVTWKAEARGSNYNVTLDGFCQPDGKPGPKEISEVVDLVSEVWVIDRRAFTNAFVNSLNQGDALDNSAPRPLNYVNVLKWLESITTARKNGQPYYVIHQNKVRAERSGFNKFEGEFKVWELPSGVFQPIFLAITEGGGVAVMDYEAPDNAGIPGGKEYPLQGFNLPTWAANLLDVVGVAANLPEGETDLHNRFGDGFMKIGSFSPKAEARIGLDPVTNTPEQNSYLTYKYVIGMDLPLGEPTTESGPLNMGPKFLGLKFTGANAEFEVIGKDRKAGLAVNFGAAPPDELERRDKEYHPVLSEGAEEEPEKPYDVELEFAGKFAILETLEPGWLGRNRVSSFGYGLEAEGKVNVEANFNATPVVGKIPYVGPVLLALDKSGLFTILAEIEGTLGMKIAAEQLTEFPVGGVTVSGKPARLGFLGESTRKLEVKMYLRVAGGLGISALGGRARATALLQVGPPSFTPDVDGVVFTFDPLGQGNLLTKIEGALSVVLKAKLNMLTFNVSKEMQWDIARFVIDRGSEPSFELNPLNISYFVTTPVTSLPQAFIGKETNIIDNFYAAGSLDLANGASPLLVFTGIDGAGKMTVMASFRAGSGWSVPVQLGSAAGLISVTVAEQPAGGFLVAWSEVAEADMGNAFPPTTIKFVRSNAAGGGWSAPAVVTTMAAAITDLKLVRAGAKLVLLSLVESDGPQGEKTLRSTAWDGSTWAASQSIPAAGDVRSYDATGNADGDALAVASTTTGNLVSLRWQGSAWVAEGSPGSHAGPALSTALDGFEGLLAWIGTNNRLEISRFNDGTGQWGKVATLTTNAVGLECKLTVLTNNSETLYLAAWVSGAEKSSLFYAVVDRTGALRVPPTEITPGSQGAYSRLELRSLPNLRASLLASFTSGTNTNVREYMLGLPSARDCDGDGIDDALAISTGLVADCNGNGIPDLCDLRAGRSVDRDGDGILDSCQPPLADDCDRNGVSDRYQLALGIGDANKNGVLDACESGLRIKRVVFPSAARQTYYRAPGLRLKSLTAGTAEMEYQGVLEKTEDLNKPWTPVP